MCKLIKPHKSYLKIVPATCNLSPASPTRTHSLPPGCHARSMDLLPRPHAGPHAGKNYGDITHNMDTDFMQAAGPLIWPCPYNTDRGLPQYRSESPLHRGPYLEQTSLDKTSPARTCPVNWDDSLTIDLMNLPRSAALMAVKLKEV